MRDKLLQWLLAACCIACLPCGVAVAQHQRVVPDYGLMLNDDGDFSFTDADPQTNEANLRRMIRSLGGTAVRTLVYSVATGSDILLYPSEAGSVYGWREAAGESKPPWNTRMPIMRAAVAQQVDAVRIADDEAKRMGLLFVPTFRMNDAHFVHEPMDNVLTGRFWIEHHERFTIGQSPIRGYDGYRHLLDFTHEAVREHRLAVISEVVDRYADVSDGLQLDFMRHPIFFAPGTASEHAHLMTELVGQVRAKLDAAGARVGRYLPLQVRVPPSLRNCAWAGLEVEQWIQRRLVDVVIPSPSMTLAHDMPVDEFVAIASPAGVKVYAALFPRTQYDWPMSLTPDASHYSGVVDRDVSAAQTRGAAVNYLAMGATGFELYNVNLPWDPAGREMVEALAQPHMGDRIFAATPAYWTDNEDAYEYRKQVPVKLAPGQAATIKMIVGDIAPESEGERRALRIGLHGMTPDTPAGAIIAINGVRVWQGDLRDTSVAVTGRWAHPSKLHPPAVQRYLQIDLTDTSALRRGENELRVVVDGGAAPMMIVEAQMAVFRSDSLESNRKTR